MDSPAPDAPVCRMCFASAEETLEELISPCCCRGTLAFVHFECVLRHYETRGIWWDLSCPTCEFPYSGDVAIELGQHGLRRAEEEFGPDSPEVAVTLVSLGSSHGLNGQVEPQRDLLERALEILLRELGPDDPEVARALVGLGFAHGALGDVHLQCALLERALEINERAHGRSSPEVAHTLTVMANAFARVQDATRQLELNQRALEIYQESSQRSGVATALMGLGNAYGDLGDAKRKRELLENALGLMVQVYGHEHVQVATVLANLGKAQATLHQLPPAISLLHRAHRIFLREFGADDRDAQLAAEALEELAAPDEARLGAGLLRTVWCPRRPVEAAFGALLLRAALAAGREDRNAKVQAGVGLLRAALAF